MISKRIASIFRSGSRTYFYSSVFFPGEVRDDVFKLYAFVRVADDFVDQVPQDVEGFDRFVARYRSAAAGEPVGDEVIDGFVELARRRSFEPAWIDAFLAAMRQDVDTSAYESIEEVKAYMYGSADVIGLMMARVLDLPEASHPTAQRLGTAMQYLNFLRDVDHDQQLGRTYVPRDVLRRHGLASPKRSDASAQPEAFRAMMRAEVRRYLRWQAEAELGYKYLPRRYRIPIQTAADMYVWTALQIDEEPMRVFERQIKPSVWQIVKRVVRNAVRATMQPQESEYASGTDVVRPSLG